MTSLSRAAAPVAGTHEDEDADGGATAAAVAHAAATPPAPDQVSGRTWKHDGVRRVLADQPGSAGEDALHAVGPDPLLGLTDSDLASMDRVVRGEAG